MTLGEIKKIVIENDGEVPFVVNGVSTIYRLAKIQMREAYKLDGHYWHTDHVPGMVSDQFKLVHVLVVS